MKILTSLAQKAETVKIAEINSIEMIKILNSFCNINSFNCHKSYLVNTEIKNFCPFNSNEVESNRLNLSVKLIKSIQELNFYNTGIQ